MRREEQELLLTVGRVLRAHMRDVNGDSLDIAALSEALAPFDGTRAIPLNEHAAGPAAAQSLAEKVTLADGSPVSDDHREIDPATGQQKAYVVLSEAERAKGFVRPLRRSYTHTTCGTETRMGPAIAETYARSPGFYTGTFCVGCRQHFPLAEFVWTGTTEQVGS